ncbi:hypothetical protein, partial [Cronobacter sakazakii]
RSEEGIVLVTRDMLARLSA